MFISIFKIWHGNYRTKECKYTDWIFCWVQVLKSGIPGNPEALGADLAPVDILANILANVATLLLLHWTTSGLHLLQTHLPKHFHVRFPPQQFNIQITGAGMLLTSLGTSLHTCLGTVEGSFVHTGTSTSRHSFFVTFNWKSWFLRRKFVGSRPFYIVGWSQYLNIWIFEYLLGADLSTLLAGHRATLLSRHLLLDIPANLHHKHHQCILLIFIAN